MVTERAEGGPAFGVALSLSLETVCTVEHDSALSSAQNVCNVEHDRAVSLAQNMFIVEHGSERVELCRSLGTCPPSNTIRNDTTPLTRANGIHTARAAEPSCENHERSQILDSARQAAVP